MLQQWCSSLRFLAMQRLYQPPHAMATGLAGQSSLTHLHRILNQPLNLRLLAAAGAGNREELCILLSSAEMPPE
jgi:hypothetical protein